MFSEVARFVPENIKRLFAKAERSVSLGKDVRKPGEMTASRKEVAANPEKYQVAEYHGVDTKGQKQDIALLRYEVEQYEHSLKEKLFVQGDVENDKGEWEKALVGKETLFLNPRDRVIMLDQIDVSETYQGRGLGRAAVKATIDYLNRRIAELETDGEGAKEPWTVRTIPLNPGFHERVFVTYFNAQPTPDGHMLEGRLPTAQQVEAMDREEQIEAARKAVLAA